MQYVLTIEDGEIGFRKIVSIAFMSYGTFNIFNMARERSQANSLTES